MCQGPLRHSCSDGFADGAVLPEKGWIDTEHTFLGLIAVGDKSALKYIKSCREQQ